MKYYGAKVTGAKQGRLAEFQLRLVLGKGFSGN